MVWPLVKGPAVVRVFTTDTSAEAAAVPPLPVLSELLFVFGSGSVADTVAVLSKAPTALIVAVTLMVRLAAGAGGEVGQGSGAPPPSQTLVMVRLDGVSVTCTFVAVDGPALATTSV